MSREPLNTEISVQYDSETNTYNATFDGTEIKPSTAVVKVMASVCGTEPTNLDPLYNVIDPTKLDSLILQQVSGHPDGDCIIEVTYLGYKMTVKSYGIIAVEPFSDDVVEIP